MADKADLELNTKSLTESAARVRAAIVQYGYDLEVIELSQSTRTAAEAAQAVGCAVAQIAKSLVFRGRNTGQAVLVIASGSNRVDENLLQSYLGEPLEKADADFVRQQTGYVIGGVPPIAHVQALKTFLDEDLATVGQIWAAAGNPFAVFSTDWIALQRMTDGTVVRVKK